jgi:adenylate cyclase
MADRLPRKLAAILYADVAGYSRLTGEDEDGTHLKLRMHLDFISESIQAHDGRIVHYAGDAVLADFGTVIDALSCATAIQLELADRNSGVPDEKKVQFRIGVNLGDVIVDEHEIYGDGVNVAARLESLAEAGGICVSDAVRTAVGKKLGLYFEDMGAREVKNIAEPVRSFHVRFRAEDVRLPADPPAPGSASGANVPTVVILPFRFIGNPGEHEHIAAALTESVGSALAHFRDYKILEDDDAGAATYALNGTLQIAGPRIRISLQLLAGDDGRKLWTEKFDRKLDDVFELQDEISAIVAAYLGEAIWQETARALAGKNRENFTAVDWSYYAIQHIHRLTRSDFAESKAACERAMNLDSELLLPKFILAFTLTAELSWGWATDAGEARATALTLTQESLLKDSTNANSHRLAGRLYSILGRHAEALSHSERALTLNPYDGDILVLHSLTLMQAGQADEAIPWVEKALRYNPHPPAYYRHVLILVQFFAGHYASALESLRRAEGGLQPLSRFVAIAILQMTGCHEEADTEVAALLADDAGASIQNTAALFANYKNSAQVEILLNGLRGAGLPEQAARGHVDAP